MSRENAVFGVKQACKWFIRTYLIVLPVLIALTAWSGKNDFVSPFSISFYFAFMVGYLGLAVGLIAGPPVDDEMPKKKTNAQWTEDDL